MRGKVEQMGKGNSCRITLEKPGTLKLCPAAPGTNQYQCSLAPGTSLGKETVSSGFSYLSSPGAEAVKHSLP